MAIYNGKHCVFEQVGIDKDNILWNSASNVDSDNARNDWNISDIRNTGLPARLLLLSSALQDNLTNTTIQTVTNGINGTLVSTSDKLFLAAEKEMSGTRSLSRIEEFNALTTWSYYTAHTQASDRVKYTPSNNANGYSLRSPRSDNTEYMVFVGYNGSFNAADVEYTMKISPCFAF